ncbi:MAG: hypothetical protein JSU63_19425 [Phycisphaerales bacterium]|nr:MAG: hypothetical protein JSU63_19425 [Phycisphaerales bacterium]
MYHRAVLVLVVLVGVLLAQASADVVVTLEPKDADANPVTTAVDAGTTVFVDILLAADEADTPLADVRLLRFDFTETSSTLSLGEFAWTFDSLENDGLYLLDEVREELLFSAAYISTTAVEGAVVALGGTAVRVATLEVTVNGTGTLDGIGPVEPAAGRGAFFTAGFETPVNFSLAENNLSGGALTIRATGTTLPDADGDGVPDVEDAFPSDPNESVDTDGDEVGDNSDAFPEDPTEDTDTDGDGTGNHADLDDDNDGVADVDDPAPLEPGDGGDDDNTNQGPAVTGGICGLGMVGASLAILCGLTGMRRRRFGLQR